MIGLVSNGYPVFLHLVGYRSLVDIKLRTNIRLGKFLPPIERMEDIREAVRVSCCRYPLFDVICLPIYFGGIEPRVCRIIVSR